MILSCSNISKAFGTEEILKHVSFHVEDHEKPPSSASTDR